MNNLQGFLYQFTIFCKDAFVQGRQQPCPFPTLHSHLCSPTVPQTGISCWPPTCLLPFFGLDGPAVLLGILPHTLVCAPAQCGEGDRLSRALQCVRLKLCACGGCPPAVPEVPIPNLRKQSNIAGTLKDTRASPSIRETPMTSPSS